MRDASGRHYEVAFENWLIENHVQYVKADEHARPGPAGASVKNFDFLLYPRPGRRVIAEVKGRTFRGTALARRTGLECWVTQDDLASLHTWQQALGPDHEAIFVFAYRVLRSNSKWHVSYERRLDIVPGYNGLVYVDRDTRAVMRVTLEAQDIPSDFPVQQAGTTLDYDYAEISGQRYILPLRAVVRMRAGKFLSKNEVEFRMYRKFGAEAIIKFETPEPLPEEKINEQPPKP